MKHLAFRRRVAQEQFFAAREILRQGRFVIRVNGAIAVAELCPRHHIATIGRTVKIHTRHQRQLNQLTTHHFRRVFREVMDISPLQYRKKQTK